MFVEPSSSQSKQIGFRDTLANCSRRMIHPRRLNPSESRQLLVRGGFGWRLQELEQFYREVHALDGKDPKFPVSYPTSALLGTVNVINCVEARIITMLHCRQFLIYCLSVALLACPAPSIQAMLSTARSCKV